MHGSHTQDILPSCWTLYVARFGHVAVVDDISQVCDSRAPVTPWTVAVG